jgi:hypothetical protein
VRHRSRTRVTTTRGPHRSKKVKIGLSLIDMHKEMDNKDQSNSVKIFGYRYFGLSGRTEIYKEFGLKL